MVWSHSRISSFHECPYQFFLRYIKLCEKQPCFFASYGSFVHSLTEQFYSGKASAASLVSRYLLEFRTEVEGRAPSFKIFDSYFRQGLAYLQNLKPLSGSVLSTEQEVHFTVGDKPFVGFVDLVCRDEDGRLCIVDHKSRALKPRSGKEKPTRSDAELDRYLRQLYLYSIPVSEQYGRTPDRLIFNCYRTGEWISEDFRPEGLAEAKAWALSSIAQINSAQGWPPNVDFWKCRYLCGLAHECEYCQMAGGYHP